VSPLYALTPSAEFGSGFSKDSRYILVIYTKIYLIKIKETKMSVLIYCCCIASLHVVLKDHHQVDSKETNTELWYFKLTLKEISVKWIHFPHQNTSNFMTRLGN
jgi:hypothetical protein